MHVTGVNEDGACAEGEKDNRSTRELYLGYLTSPKKQPQAARSGGLNTGLTDACRCSQHQVCLALQLGVNR